MKRSFLYLIVGAIAGVLLFLVSEPFMPRGIGTEAASAKHSSIVGFASGIFLIGLLGLLSGWLQGSRTHLLKGLGFGVLIGAVTGPTAIGFANRIFNSIAAGSSDTIARVPGWAVFGLLLGVGVALAEATIIRSAVRTYSALIGGLVGGALGGFLFELVAQIVGQSLAQAQGTGDVGGPSRAIGFTCLCGCIGLFIGVAQALSARAKIRLVFGRNEFKEWTVDAGQTTIGRSENAGIPIFSDPQIAPIHATIVRQGGRFIIHDAGTPVGIGVNGVRVPQAELRHGDQINMGSLTLQFLLAGGARLPDPMPVQAQPAQPFAQPQPTSMPTTAIPTQPQSFARLVAVSGPLAGQTFPVQGSLEIGREANGVRLVTDSAVSRSHAVVTLEPQGLTVRDLSSKNGTFVNGNRLLGPKLLVNGDVIQVGSTQFRVE